MTLEINGVRSTRAEAARLRKLLVSQDPLIEPLVIKVVDSRVVHKSRVGGVARGVTYGGVESEIAAMLLRLDKRGLYPPRALLVEEMVFSDLECFVGLTIDPSFGRVMAVGLGGLGVEAMGAVRFLQVPMKPQDLRSRALPELTAALDQIGAADAFRGFLLELADDGGLLLDDGIEELEFNPIAISGERIVVLDAWGRWRQTGHADSEALPPLPPAPIDGRALFFPDSMVVAGASPRRKTLGTSFIRSQREAGYGGEIYVERDDGAAVPGARTIASRDEVDGLIDYGYVAVPHDAVLEIVSAWAGKVRVIQILTSGFGEIDQRGKQVEQELVEAVAGTGTRLIGPNSWGVYSPQGKVTFGGGIGMQPGNVAVVSQSGGIASEVVMRTEPMGVRFAAGVSLGNCADLSMVDLLEYVLTRNDVTVVGAYMETIGDGCRLTRALSAGRGPDVPLVVLKGGVTEQGQRAARSHTGAIATDARVWGGIAAQYGIVVVRSVEELATTLATFALFSDREATGGHYVLAGPGGGAGVSTSDEFARCGLQLADLPPDVVADLEALGFPPGTSFRNPIDIPVFSLQAQQGRLFGEALARLALAPGVGTLVVHLNLVFLLRVVEHGEEVVNRVVDALDQLVRQHRSRCRWCIVLRAAEDVPTQRLRLLARERLAAAGALVVEELEDAARAFGHLDQWLDRPRRTKA
ncbi:MAG TPA: acetate--CoA ligase family protein [Acidimicrobiales bacterium]|nr:acetate--CoA ligase family protein [Acidimicrobiales bacterium]